MVINEVISNTSLSNKQPNNVKNIINKVQRISKLGHSLNKEVTFLQSELGKWKFQTQ